MRYLKFSANKIFTGYQFLDNHVIVTNSQGVIEDVVPNTFADDSDIQFFEGILLPGFVNTHCHLELSYLKNKIEQHTGLSEFILQIVANRNKYTQEEIEQAIDDANTEMYNNGIVAVGDICNTNNSITQKKSSSIYYHNFLEVMGWLPNIALKRFEDILHLKKKFDDEDLQNSIAAHAPYSVSENLWQLIKDLFIKSIVSMHNQEATAEDELFKKGTGNFIDMYKKMGICNNQFFATAKSSIQSVYQYLQNAQNVILVHNTFTSIDDIQFIEELSPNTFYCLCPNANKYIENTLPNVEMLHQQKCNITLGTDSLASNSSLSIYDEIKTIQQNFKNIDEASILQWATINGAKALGVSNQYGSFEKGKKPGIIQINSNTVNRII